MKLLLILVLIVLTFASFVLATGDLSCNIRTTCNTDEITILKFADSGHASTPDSVNAYSNKVCCKSANNRVTATQILTGTGLDTANGYLRLSSTTNAHSELFNTITPLYNNLLKFISTVTVNCASKTACLDEETCLFSMSGDTNAIVGDCTKFPTKKICCTSGSLVAPVTCSTDSQCPATQTCQNNNCADTNNCIITKAEWRHESGTTVTSNVNEGTNLKTYVEARGNCAGKQADLDLILKNEASNKKTKLVDFSKFKRIRDFFQGKGKPVINLADNKETIASKIDFPSSTNILTINGNVFTGSANYRILDIPSPSADPNPNGDDATPLPVGPSRIIFDATISSTP